MTKKRSYPKQPIVDKGNTTQSISETLNPLLAAHHRIGEKLRASGSIEIEDTASPSRTPTYQARFVPRRKQKGHGKELPEIKKSRQTGDKE